MTQETLLTAYQRLRQLRDHGKFRPWLFSILRRKCQDYLRTHQAHELSLEAYPEIPTTAIVCADRDLLTLVNSLPLTDREVLAARYLSELHYDEIALALGCSVQTAYVRCKRAREKLRALMLRADEEENAACCSAQPAR